MALNREDLKKLEAEIMGRIYREWPNYDEESLTPGDRVRLMVLDSMGNHVDTVRATVVWFFEMDKSCGSFLELRLDDGTPEYHVPCWMVRKVPLLETLAEI